MTIHIRKAEAADFESIYTLIKDFAEFIKTPEKVLTSAAQMMEDKDYFNCLVAINGDTIIGFATYFFAYYSWTGKSLYLDDLYVVAPYRGMGIGSRLLDEIIAIAKKENCKKLRWQVSNWNEKAIAFYKMRGATVDEVEINCDLKI